MARLVRFQVDESDSVVVEVDDGDASSQVGVSDVIEDAADDFSAKLGSVRKAVEVALRELGETLNPETLKVSFGVKLNAQAGAVIAKTSVEGNLHVEMEWKPKSTGPVPD